MPREADSAALPISGATKDERNSKCICSNSMWYSLHNHRRFVEQLRTESAKSHRRGDDSQLSRSSRHFHCSGVLVESFKEARQRVCLAAQQAPLSNSSPLTLRVSSYLQDQTAVRDAIITANTCTRGRACLASISRFCSFVLLVLDVCDRVCQARDVHHRPHLFPKRVLFRFSGKCFSCAGTR